MKPKELIDQLLQLPEDSELHFQVVDSLGNAFSMWPSVAVVPGSNNRMSVLTLSHPQLIDLYDIKRPG